MKTWIQGGYLINPKTKTEGYYDVVLEDGVIADIRLPGELSEEKSASFEILDATGLTLVPGFIDLHVHLREPGFEHKETIYTGTRACAKGGYTTVACMPNTKPALDTPEHIRALKAIIERDAVIEVLPVGAITFGLAGEKLTDHKALFESGAVALSDDGKTTMSEIFMAAALKHAREYGRFVTTHSEDHRISGQYKDSVYPLHAETDIVERDIRLCEAVDGILHVGHVSGAETLDAIRKAKSKGISVTCEATPHHFALDDTMVNVMDPQAKVNPPIRSEAHRQAVVKAILDGTVDIIATDHAPHDAESKQKPYSEAAYGISGIESAFSIAYTTLVLKNQLPMMRLVEMMTSKPASIAKINSVGSIEIGKKANLTLLDLAAQITVEPDQFISKGKNTPFRGMTFQGEVVMTLYGGEIVYKRSDN
jgi:dihydroorotase